MNGKGDFKMIAKLISFKKPENMQPLNITIDNCKFKNTSLYYTYTAASGDCHNELCKKLYEYNSYEKFLFSLNGFVKSFIEKNYTLSYDQAVNLWGKDTAAAIFAEDDYPFKTQFIVFNNNLMLHNFELNYKIELDAMVVQLKITNDDIIYSKGDKTKCVIVNSIDNKNDIYVYLYGILWDLNLITSDDERFEAYDAYEQWRLEDKTVNLHLERCWEVLKSMGYAQEYEVVSNVSNLYWNYAAQSNGAIIIALLDTTFNKNMLAMDKLKLILNSSEKDIKTKHYFLTDSDNMQYLSDEKGTLGGHWKLKIYGELNCKSANHYIDKGQYVRNRVFFKSESVAISAGYRPCAVCMREKYDLWKKLQK